MSEFRAYLDTVKVRPDLAVQDEIATLQYDGDGWYWENEAGCKPVRARHAKASIESYWRSHLPLEHCTMRTVTVGSRDDCFAVYGRRVTNDLVRLTGYHPTEIEAMAEYFKGEKQ